MAAAGGAGVGGAVALLICVALRAVLDDKVVDQIQPAIALLAPLVLSYFAGYFTPPGASESVIHRDDGKLVSAT